jgi:hypothetical protein
LDNDQVNRRDFIKSLLKAAAGITTASVLAPDMLETILKGTTLGASEPMRPALGSRYPVEAFRYVIPELSHFQNLEHIPTGELTTTASQSGLYSLDRMPLTTEKYTTDVYAVRPAQKAALSVITTANPYFHNTDNWQTLTAQLRMFADAAKIGSNGSENTLLGAAKPMPTSPHHVEIPLQTHTIPNAIVVSSADIPIAVSSLSWTNHMAINYSRTASARTTDGKPLSPTEWHCLSSNSGVWTPDMIEKWGEKLFSDVQLNKNIWKSKFTEYGWTEVPEDHPAYHRVLRISPEGMTVIDAADAWDELDNKITNRSADLDDTAYVRPGFIATPLDPPMSHRQNNMTLNGMLLDQEGNFIGILTLYQEIRLNWEQIKNICKDYLTKNGLDNENFYYVGFDEHRGGGMIIRD